MTELIHECSYQIQDEKGRLYSVRAYAKPSRNTLWDAWLEFRGPRGAIFRTERETTQLSLADAIYWAEGLEPVFLEGAFERARRLVKR